MRFWLLPPEFDQGKPDTLKLISVLTSRIADARSDISDPSHAFNGSRWTVVVVVNATTADAQASFLLATRSFAGQFRFR